MNDGWHTIMGRRIFVEDGKVIRGLKGEDWNPVTAYPYKANQYAGGWDNAVGVKVSTFISGLRRGNYELY